MKYKDFIITEVTNETPGFYNDLGPIFGSREIENFQLPWGN